MPAVLITGASRGIGLEMALQYAGDGWQVHACCRNPAAASDLAELAGSARGRVVVHRLDVCDHAAVDALADELSDTALDLLVNNAGRFGAGGFSAGKASVAFGHSDFADWERTFRVNTFAPMKMAEAFVDHLATSGGGKLVTLSSTLGSIARNSSGGMYQYRASKAAVNALMKALSVDLKPRGIIVAALHPGWVRTDMGGSEADIGADISVAGLRQVIAGLDMAHTGCFLDYRGRTLDW